MQMMREMPGLVANFTRACQSLSVIVSIVKNGYSRMTMVS
jgi:hypothetical protein